MRCFMCGSCRFGGCRELSGTASRFLTGTGCDLRHRAAKGGAVGRRPGLYIGHTRFCRASQAALRWLSWSGVKLMDMTESNVNPEWPPPPAYQPRQPTALLTEPVSRRRTRKRGPVALLTAVAIAAAAVGGGTAYGIQELTDGSSTVAAGRPAPLWSRLARRARSPGSPRRSARASSRSAPPPAPEPPPAPA
ncbi:hypothetical protein SGLAM104S_10686 [Streptomyces glaucescens]